MLVDGIIGGPIMNDKVDIISRSPILCNIWKVYKPQNLTRDDGILYIQDIAHGLMSQISRPIGLFQAYAYKDDSC